MKAYIPNQGKDDSRLPMVTVILLIDDSPDSASATKLLQESGIRFLTMRTSNDSVPRPPLLLADNEPYQGVVRIQEYLASISDRMGVKSSQVDLTLTALRRLELLSSFATFNDRMRLQKEVYLLQHFGLPTAWKFSWYLRGPYSPDLAHAVLEGSTGHAGSRLDSQASRAIDEFRERLNPDRMTSAEWEAAASVLYVGKQRDRTWNSQEELVNDVMARKPQIPKATISKYVEMFWSEIS